MTVSPAKVADNALYNTMACQLNLDYDRVMLFFGQGTAHFGNNYKIRRRTYTISTDTWSDVTTCFDTPGISENNTSCGKIGDRIFVFYQKNDYDEPLGQGRSVSSSYRYSDDNAVSWSDEITPFPNTATHGHSNAVGSSIFQLDSSSSIYYKAMFQATYDTVYQRLFLVKTTDRGVTWTEDTDRTIWEATGNIYLSEMSVFALSGNKLMALCRQTLSATANGTRQLNSLDGGLTWDDKGRTNIGAATGTTQNNKLYAIYDDVTDRVILGNAYQPDLTYRFSSDNNPDTEDAGSVWNDELSWDNTNIFTDPGGPNGDVNGGIIKTGDSTYLATWCQQYTASDADVWYTVQGNNQFPAPYIGRAIGLGIGKGVLG